MKKKFLIPAIVVLVLLLVVGIFWSKYNNTRKLIDEMLLDKISFVDKDILRSPIFNTVLDKRLTKLVEDAKSPTFIFSLSEEEMDDWFDLGINPIPYFENMLELFEKNSFVMDSKTEEIINKHFMDVIAYRVEKKGIKPTVNDVFFFQADTQRNLALDYLESMAVDELTSLKNQYTQNKDANLFYNDFMPLLTLYQERFDAISYTDYLKADELKAFFSECGTPTICVDGKGGYYDTHKDEYIAKDYGSETLAENLFAEVEEEREVTYLFYGDFMLKLLHTRVSVSNTDFYNWLADTTSDDKDVFVSNIKTIAYYKGKTLSAASTPISYGKNASKTVFMLGETPVSVGDNYFVYGDEIIHLG